LAFVASSFDSVEALFDLTAQTTARKAASMVRSSLIYRGSAFGPDPDAPDDGCQTGNPWLSIDDCCRDENERWVLLFWWR